MQKGSSVKVESSAQKKRVKVSPKEKHRAKTLRLFKPNGLLQAVAMDISVPLPKTKNSSQSILVRTDRYITLARAIPLSKLPHLL